MNQIPQDIMRHRPPSLETLTEAERVAGQRGLGTRWSARAPVAMWHALVRWLNPGSKRQKPKTNLRALGTE